MSTPRTRKVLDFPAVKQSHSRTATTTMAKTPVTLRDVAEYTENLRLVEAQRCYIAAANLRGAITPEAREYLARYFEAAYRQVVGGINSIVLVLAVCS
jgi:hypothetical protein